jgi:DNA-directed RNA polymerase specialized sigma subunit
MSDVKNKDIELWTEWKRTQSPPALQKLLNQMSPIINREVNKWAPSISRSLLEAEGKRLAVAAFKDYDPARGVALSTFVASRLPKLSRLVYSSQNAARMSETKALGFHAYTAAYTELKDTHGREPTALELSDQLGWSPKKLEQFQRQSSRKEYVESEEHPDMDDSDDDHLVDFIYHDLAPLQQKIFEHSSGYLGASRLSGKEMMSKLSITQGQLSYQKNLIVQAIERARGKHG